MSGTRSAGGDEPDRRGDDDLIALLGESNDWLRGFLCTLARRGAGFRRRHPARAARLIDTVSRWPVVKGGQFLFDLMEWEDFMIDGSPPPITSSALTGASWVRIAKLLRDRNGPWIRRHGGPRGCS
ncbi:hypothetical protein [Nocardia sp. BMG51109]|uniref:hypothetical protein n=1 Tax=Nocardia sp. BMG51109 TaxID=1056816 RepID=UPI0004673710|nr:hypothetical protein [Nocardia sp. BMG51109]